MEIKVTKRTKIKEVNNDMCHNWYYLINGKIINNEGTRCRPFRFVVWFDVYDVMENARKEDTYTKQDIKDCLDMCVFGYTDTIRGYEPEQCREFFNLCKDSIENWNNKQNYIY